MKVAITNSSKLDFPKKAADKAVAHEASFADDMSLVTAARLVQIFRQGHEEGHSRALWDVHHDLRRLIASIPKGRAKETLEEYVEFVKERAVQAPRW